MFEFHGWATIVVRTDEDSPGVAARTAHADAVARLRRVVAAARDRFSLVDVHQTGNGQTVLIVHGLRNHRVEKITDLFKWVAAELPGSYGLLYVHDDEAVEHDNSFRVWRLARGRVEEQPDPFLSPRILTVEAPFGR